MLAYAVELRGFRGFLDDIETGAYAQAQSVIGACLRQASQRPELLTFAASECGIDGAYQGPLQFRYRHLLDELRGILSGLS